MIGMVEMIGTTADTMVVVVGPTIDATIDAIVIAIATAGGLE